MKGQSLKHSHISIRTVCALVALAGMLAGCSGSRTPVYVASEELPPIRVPEGLTRPASQSAFEIPGFSLPELAARGDESRPPQVLPSSEAEQMRSRVRFGPTGLYLEVQDDAASVWRRLGFALNRGGMSIEEVLFDDRRFLTRFEHEPIVAEERGFISRLFLFWRSPEVIDYSGLYVLEVLRETAQTTRIAIFSQDGSILPMEQAEYVLIRLQRRLG